MDRRGIHSKNVLLGEELQEATIIMRDGNIESISKGPKQVDLLVEDYGSLVIMPGLIDSHVHINEPGRTDWEGFDTATKAAAAGGVTTLVDMPLNSSPVTISAENFDKKLQAAKGKLHVNCGFWGGLIPGSEDLLPELLDAGVLGVKIFLTHSGIDEFPNVGLVELERVASHLDTSKITVLAHCELSTDHKGLKLLDQNPESYQAYLNSRPKTWEDEAIKLIIGYSHKFGVKTHIVHLSSSDSLEQIKVAREQGLSLTVETCPHYLYFQAGEIKDGSTIHKCAPPIRDRENNDLLLEAIETGLIDFVVTDHSPAPPELKRLDTGDFKKAWGGIASLELSLSIMWQIGQIRNWSIGFISKLMSSNISKFLGLDQRKGKIEVGFDADLTVWDPSEQFIIDQTNLHQKHKICPYHGQQLIGKVKATYVNGKLVYDNGEFLNLNSGKILLRDL